MLDPYQFRRTIVSMAVDAPWLADVEREARRMPRPDGGRRKALVQKR